MSLSLVLGSTVLITERVLTAFLGQHDWEKLLYEHYSACKIARPPKRQEKDGETRGLRNGCVAKTSRLILVTIPIGDNLNGII